MALFHLQYDPHGQITSDGITLLEYYAAHAPEAPEYFKPLMQEDEPKRPVHYMKREGLTESDRQYFKRNLYEDDWTVGCKPSPRRKNMIDMWRADMIRWRNDITGYEQEYNIQRIVQWRFYYASKMVEQTHSLD